MTAKLELHLSLTISVHCPPKIFPQIVKDVIGLSILEFFYTKPLTEKTFVCLYSEMYGKFKDTSETNLSPSFCNTKFEAKLLTVHHIIKESLVNEEICVHHNFIYMEYNTPSMLVEYDLQARSISHNTSQAKYKIDQGYVFLESVPRYRKLKHKSLKFLYMDRHVLNFDLPYVLEKLKLNQKMAIDLPRIKEMEFDAPLQHPLPAIPKRLALTWPSKH